MNFPDDLRYSSDHEWARTADGKIRIGITDYAQDALGDVVFIEVPAVGSKVAAQDKRADRKPGEKREKSLHKGICWLCAGVPASMRDSSRSCCRYSVDFITEMRE